MSEVTTALNAAFTAAPTAVSVAVGYQYRYQTGTYFDFYSLETILATHANPEYFNVVVGSYFTAGYLLETVIALNLKMTNKAYVSWTWNNNDLTATFQG